MGTCLQKEKRPRPLSLLWSFLPGLEKRAPLCHTQHHDVGPSIGLKAIGTTSHRLESLRSSANPNLAP